MKSIDYGIEWYVDESVPAFAFTLTSADGKTCYSGTVPLSVISAKPSDTPWAIRDAANAVEAVAE